jgi:hypothetical protein
MARRLTTRRMLTNALVDTNSTVIKTDRFDNMFLAVKYERVSGAGAGRLYVYGAMDETASIKYLIGFAPVLTATRDTDGLVAWTTSVNIMLQIYGVHPYIYVVWDETTDPARCTVDLYGMEDI